MNRIRQLLCVGVASCALLTASDLPAASALADTPLSPENLRCQGEPVPPAPGPGWTVEPVWEWRDVARVEGNVGSSEGPHAVALDSQCNIYLTDSEHFQIIKLSKDGTVLSRWAEPGVHPAEADEQSSSPRGIAVDGQGNVYVTDTPNDRVYKLSPQGQLMTTWGACPDGTSNCDPKLVGRFLEPDGIAVDGKGNVFVAEHAGARMQQLESDGTPGGAWDFAKLGMGDAFVSGSLAIDQAGSIYMAEAFNNQIVKFDRPSGKVAAHWGGTRGGAPGQFHGPLGVGIDVAGNMYVSDTGNWRVQKLTASGGFVDQWRNCLDGDPPCEFPDAGPEPGQFFAARGVTVDGQGTVYVADTANKRLQRLMIVDWNLIPPPDEGGD